MNYKNQRPAKRNDQVVGQDPGGNPLSGQVIELNSAVGSVLVSPFSHSPVWVKSERCLHVDDAFAENNAKPEKEGPVKPEGTPQGPESTGDQKPPLGGSEGADTGTHQI